MPNLAVSSPTVSRPHSSTGRHGVASDTARRDRSSWSKTCGPAQAWRAPATTAAAARREPTSRTSTTERCPTTHHPVTTASPTTAYVSFVDAASAVDAPGQGRPHRIRPQGRGGHGQDDEGRCHRVDVGAEHPDPEDERVERPQHVDPTVEVGSQHPPQRRPHDQPGEDDEQLPHPDALAQRVATHEGREPVEERPEGPVDAGLGRPRLLDPARDRVRPTGPLDRGLEPRVTTTDEDSAVGEVVDVVRRAERCRDQGQPAEQDGDRPRAQGRSGASAAPPAPRAAPTRYAVQSTAVTAPGPSVTGTREPGRPAAR